jgi:integrase/recombinase XerD
VPPEEEFSIREMLEVLLGTEGKRRLRNQRKANDELFSDYEAVLKLRHRSREALEEAMRVIGHFRTFLGGFPPSPQMAVKFLAQFAERKPATLYRYNSIIKGFMQYVGEEHNHKIRVPQTDAEYVEEDDIEKVKAAIRDRRTHKRVIERNLLLVELGQNTGMRRKELSDLKVKDVHLDRGYVLVRQGKGMKDRVVELIPSLQPRLQAFLKGKKPEDPVFGLTGGAISDIIHRNGLRAGVSIHAHSLRHFFGTTLVDDGTDLETVRRLMGHSSLSVTQRYLGRTDRQRREAILRLDKNRGRRASQGRPVMRFEWPHPLAGQPRPKSGPGAPFSWEAAEFCRENGIREEECFRS